MLFWDRGSRAEQFRDCRTEQLQPAINTAELNNCAAALPEVRRVSARARKREGGEDAGHPTSPPLRWTGTRR